MPLVWRDAMAVDGGMIDRDHQALIAIINEFANFGPQVVTRENLLSTLLKLENYAKGHFRREEELQRSISYTRCEPHRREHADLIAALTNLRSEIISLQESTLIVAHKRMTGFLHRWLIDHVIKSDLAMKPFIV